MCTVKSPLNSTLILGNSLEMMISFVEVSSGCDCILLLLVKELEIHVEIVNGIKGGLGCSWIGPNRIDWSSLVIHADCIVIVFVDVPECQVCLEDVRKAGDGFLEGRIIDDFDHIWILFVLGHPFILIRAKFSRIGSEEVSIVPWRHIALLHMHGNRVI